MHILYIIICWVKDHSIIMLIKNPAVHVRVQWIRETPEYALNSVRVFKPLKLDNMWKEKNSNMDNRIFLLLLP